ELVHIIPWLDHPHLSLELLQISGEEIRKEDGRGSWRRKGISIDDRRLLEVRQSITVQSKTDLLNLIGRNFPEPCSSSYLARYLSVNPRLARKILYTLARLDLIQSVGKSGNAILYKSNMSIPESAYEKIIRRISDKPGIMREKEFRHSVVLVPFVEADGEQHLLLEKRAVTIRQGGEICFPGGEVDPRLDANIAATALRETSEELGLPTRLIELGGKLPPLLNPAYHMIDAFVGRLHLQSLSELTPDQREVEELILVPVNFFLEHPPEVYRLRMEFQPSYTDKKGKKVELLPARQLGLPRKYWTSWGGDQRPVYVYRVNNEVIWGITGEIIRELISYLEE
ncbi:MAG: NUDIX domain-containing protein, partial [Candidatus Cloacimonetes bacterium]|nr:NUDIX domain-containing protein [Candidatus Cloacimonadota bacterium]